MKIDYNNLHPKSQTIITQIIIICTSNEYYHKILTIIIPEIFENVCLQFALQKLCTNNGVLGGLLLITLGPNVANLQDRLQSHY